MGMNLTCLRMVRELSTEQRKLNNGNAVVVGNDFNDFLAFTYSTPP